eukprot:4481873-Amphidinium_carterae.1
MVFQTIPSHKLSSERTNNSNHSRDNCKMSGAQTAMSLTKVMDGGSVVKRRNYTETPEGHCVAVSAEPMPAADRARGRTHYAEAKSQERTLQSTTERLGPLGYRLQSLYACYGKCENKHHRHKCTA